MFQIVVDDRDGSVAVGQHVIGNPDCLTRPSPWGGEFAQLVSIASPGESEQVAYVASLVTRKPHTAVIPEVQPQVPELFARLLFVVVLFRCRKKEIEVVLWLAGQAQVAEKIADGLACRLGRGPAG